MAQYLPEMASKVCDGILKKLNSAGIETSQLDFQQLQDRKVGALSRPAVNISVNNATYKKITLTTYKTFMTVTVFLMVTELRGEKERRFMVLNLVEAINNALLLEKLGLELQDPLIPLSFDNVTDAAFAGAGYQIYQLKFTCSYNTTKIPDTTFGDDDDLGILKRIVMSYYLHPDDGIADSDGSMDFTYIYGGSAFSSYRKEPIFGGHAGTPEHKYSQYGIYGGNATSTY